MANYNLSLHNKIISQQMLDKLYHLWEETAKKQEDDFIFLSQSDFSKTKKTAIKNIYYHNFKLIINPEFQALLLIEKEINDFYSQVTISFCLQEIKKFYDKIKPFFSLQHNKKIEKNLDHISIGNNSYGQQFIVDVLEIFSNPLDLKEKAENNALTETYSIETILENRIKQEEILHTLTQKIQDNINLESIIQTTLDQVQSLLKIDRLFIYQINVPFEKDDEKRCIDIVTYETKASKNIDSLLSLSNDDYFKGIDCEGKYAEDFILIVDDVGNSSLDDYLVEVMGKLKVKAKIIIPIVVKHRTWALLVAHQCESVRVWHDNEIKFLKHISEYLAVAVYQYDYYQQLQEQKKALEKQVEKKAKQLQDALILAEVAQQSKSEFLGSISHELRTPLTCIIGLSGTLLHWSKDGSDRILTPEKQTRYLKIIQDNGRKLLQLINNILDFTEIESGKYLLNIEAIALKSIAQMVLLYGLEIARNKGVMVQMDYRVEENEDLFYADGERLYQILLNLIDNAIKFTGAGGEVILRVWREGNQGVFQVEDTGIGICEEQLPLLFTKFQQLENYRTRTNPGTGLGLALTKHLVELHGGIIEVESLVDKGSSFTVYLPNSDSSPLIRQPEKSTSLPNGEVNKTVVVICEDDEIGTFLCELLTAADYQVIWLFDVTDAVSKIDLINPRVIVLEQNQSVSLTLAMEIKALSNPDVYLMIIRDEISGQDWEELSNFGVDEYLLKPLQPRILLKKINKVMERAS
ncbi:ATP-binding protein [Cyanobacterium sp. IPPAS B-1200]|uniref:ATP-binding protein n=1 Tax=Cyanobacterium sp. IPPAS B-1200 TaxID=1562720 RepID=UPI0008526C64|nr:ATP-binding protein [Cyanobacterium sp. IPPAS B-1200]OEJ79276.1 hybrid sensor histidine kinase/response regulator [Cyanobacterium sp. IPPAS B-1200]